MKQTPPVFETGNYVTESCLFSDFDATEKALNKRGYAVIEKRIGGNKFYVTGLAIKPNDDGFKRDAMSWR